MSGVEINVRVLQTKKYRQHGVLSIKAKLIGTEGTRLLREKRGQGRPHRREASRRLPDRPRKASAWSGNPYTSPPSEIRSLSADCLQSIDNCDEKAFRSSL
ncbi:hypothetical protein [Peribacillus simplex]|uniref:Uncharacterized protein n=1 Tax=Peribacillus simplex TaxID=1478 RepID=A0AAW7ILU0_9BACI|nr:hypothetical protein [Peribacillus simplex]MDM5452211.1 hypothetical protein [Peribacillus simplex]